MINYAIWDFARPSLWPVWLLGAATVSLWVSKGRIRPFAKRAATAGVLLWLLMALSPLNFWLIRALDMRFPAPDLAGMRINHIVVLAGAEKLSASQLSGRSEFSAASERVIEGAMLARRFPKATLWAVGGVRQQRWPTMPDIAWIKRAWRRLGIPDAQIRQIDGTLNTCANAIGVARAGLRGQVLLVTSAWHMPRAMACFRAAGIEPIPYPVDYETWPVRNWRDAINSSPTENLRRFDLAFHEWLGLIYYRLQGRTKELWPAPR